LFSICVLWCFVRRPLSPSFEEQSLSNESKNSLGFPVVKCFFDAGKKKDFAPCHLVTGSGFCDGLAEGCHSGEGIKTSQRGFKRAKFGQESGDWTRSPLVTLSAKKRNVKVAHLLLLPCMLHGLPSFPD
jgi:hypothetical protein